MPSRITCQCGGELQRPIPTHCPHCKARIAGVRRNPISWLLPLLVIAAAFGGLVWALVWLSGR